MEINISIGERLKEEREVLGKTQGDFALIAEAADVPGATRQSQAKYEKGLAAPGAAYLSAVASAGVDVRYVLTGERELAPVYKLAADEQLMLQYYREASPAVRKAALGALVGAMPGNALMAPSVKVGNQTSSHPGSVQVGYAAGNVSVKAGKKK